MGEHGELAVERVVWVTWVWFCVLVALAFVLLEASVGVVELAVWVLFFVELVSQPLGVWESVE